MGDYFNHWLQFGRKVQTPPRVFNVNWFRKDKDGNFLWPGFGENMRILQWIVERVQGRGHGIESPLGYVPEYKDINWEGLDFSEEQFTQLMAVDRDVWVDELSQHDELFMKLYDKLPKEFIFLRELILSSLWRAPEHWELAHE